VQSQPRHLTPAFAVSVGVHVAVFLALLFVLSHSRERTPPEATRLEPLSLVWIPDPRPPARGGGSTPVQTKPPEPVKPVVPVPQPAPAIVEPETIVPEREPEPQTTVAAVPSSAPATSEPGSPSAGVGDKGDGSGRGPDTGPGSGGTIYGIGNGVSAPVPLRRPPPAYTAEAMRARLQGVVVLNCIVRPDGKCSDIRIVKSLDMAFGLDQQAIASAAEWRFRPGTRMGEPVPVLVTLEIGFTIR
jgi:protein TonB